MIQLTGCNLNQRHKELNKIVFEAADNNANFEDLKKRPEGSDVDRLFKIDVASKCKNIDYILETMKSGDSLYISRAMNCEWILSDGYKHLINPQYLEKKIFPFMSKKMKNKFLAIISYRLRNAEKAEEFHHYCMQNHMINQGMNFLLHTSETFKLEILTLHPHVYNAFEWRNPEYLQNFIRSSFILAEHYLNVIYEPKRPWILYKLRYLYSVSENQYLDMLEKFQCRGDEWDYYFNHRCKHKQRYNRFYTYSKRFSKSVMTKHKERVLRDPYLYLNSLERNIFAKFSTSDDAKTYAVALLPEKEHEFWNKQYYNRNAYFLSLIPLEERFTFIKKIFTDKYNNEIFEDNNAFYNHGFYEMMTSQEKEDWALSQVANGKEVHGSGNDYIWYRFINFEQAFIELKKYILIAAENFKRSKIIETLIESAKTQEELLMLLNYYYDRHVNEMEEFKRSFLFKLIREHDVLTFKDVCWTAIEKLFFSLDVYRKPSHPRKSNDTEFRVLSLKYYIVHVKPVPDVFHEYVISRCFSLRSMRDGFDKNKEAEKLDKIFLYLLSCYTKHVEWLMKVNDEENKKEQDKYVGYVLDLALEFEKTFQDIPSQIKDYVMINYDVYRTHEILLHLLNPTIPEFRESDLMHYLKEDASLVVKNFNKIREYFQAINQKKRNINWLIRKLRVYFYHDIAPEYIRLLNSCLSAEELYLQCARVAVFGIFNLADEQYKIDFLQKYVPTDTKIDHINISRNLLTIQTAICSVACQSRPPLPLSALRQYIQGDYSQYCLPIFNSYLSTLTPKQCVIYVESLLNSPVSIQKHALRLAFHCFSVANLKSLVLKVWNNMKNVSLRKVLYKSLFQKVKFYHDKLTEQLELFEALTLMTKTLHQDDDNEIFDLLCSLLPDPVFGKHLEDGYKVAAQFPPRVINFERTCSILQYIITYCHKVSSDFLREIMEDHIMTVLDQNMLLDQELKEGYDKVIEVKWKLILTVIIKRNDTFFILNNLLDKCLTNWRKTHGDEYVYRKFITNFLTELDDLSYFENRNRYLEINNIFRLIVEKIDGTVPAIEVYINLLKLKTNIVIRDFLGSLNTMLYEDSRSTLVTFTFNMKNMIKEYVDSGKFFKCFCGEIVNILNNAIRRIGPNFFIQKESNNARVFLCLTLSEINNRDINFLIISLIPNNYEGPYMQEYRSVIDKLKTSDDEEIKYYMCHKFYSCDFKVRDFYKR